MQLHTVPAHLAYIAYFIILPMLLLVGLGFVIQRKLGLDNPTLVRLNFYFAIPGTVFYSIVSSPLSATDVGTVVGFTLVMQTMLALLTLAVAALRRVPRDQRAAMTAGTMFYNSGNYGLPLQEWAFRSTAETRGSHIAHQVIGLQTIVMLVQNVTNFTVGVLMASSAHPPEGAGQRAMWKSNLLHIAKFPPLYALLAALGGMAIGAVITMLVTGTIALAILQGYSPNWLEAIYKASNGILLFGVVLVVVAGLCTFVGLFAGKAAR